jgi:hypothetical protein
VSANNSQVGGDHYRTGIQHWDYVVANGLDYFQAQIIKYVTRWRKKGGVQDLDKARHFLEKYRELVEAGATFAVLGPAPGRGVKCTGKTPVVVGKVAAHREADGVCHWQDENPGTSRCGANYDGMCLSDEPREVTCAECLLR